MHDYYTVNIKEARRLAKTKADRYRTAYGILKKKETEYAQMMKVFLDAAEQVEKIYNDLPDTFPSH